MSPARLTLIATALLWATLTAVAHAQSSEGLCPELQTREILAKDCPVDCSHSSGPARVICESMGLVPCPGATPVVECFWTCDGEDLGVVPCPAPSASPTPAAGLMDRARRLLGGGP